jgi:hypothetical protein
LRVDDWMVAHGLRRSLPYMGRWKRSFATDAEQVIAALQRVNKALAMAVAVREA